MEVCFGISGLDSVGFGGGNVVGKRFFLFRFLIDLPGIVPWRVSRCFS